MGASGGQETIYSYLTKDHERLDDLLENFIVQLQDGKLAFDIFEQFNSGLKRHIQWEEELLFPLFENYTGSVNSGPTAVMRNEHIDIISLINTIADKQNNQITISNATTQLKTLLANHNFKEERILYPLMDKYFSGEEVAEGLKQMNAESSLF